MEVVTRNLGECRKPRKINEKGALALGHEDITRTSILEIERVHKRFGSLHAVNDVTIDVRRGEFLTLLGPSGCGKTTLLRMIAGFEVPSSGEIRIGGRRMNERPPYERPIGIVFQNLALFPHLSVGENLGYGLRVRRVGREEIRRRVAEALELVDLAGLEERRVHQLSGGQRQRVALARALVIRPEVLLLDEPLGALDLKLRRQLQQELKRIQQRVGTTFVFVTHDQEEALTMSDRIAVMRGGRVEQLDTPEAVYDQPRTPFVAQFVGDTNYLTGRVIAVGGEIAEVQLDQLPRAVPVRAAQHVVPGQSVGLSIRPEHMVVGPARRGAAIQLDGAVAERCFVGASTRYTLKAGDLSFIAVVPNAQVETEALQPGQPVRFGWHAHDAALVPLDAPDPADDRSVESSTVQTDPALRAVRGR